MAPKKKATYAFIDASNIIYGTRDEGWKVDFQKLFKYLKERYSCNKIYYFGGLEPNNDQQKKFYKKLELFGYDLVLKPVKLYRQDDGSVVRKANCYVDLTFYAMRDKDTFQTGIFMSGDGDFAILFEHFLKISKKVLIFANSRRTAKEVKILKGIIFNDLRVLKPTIEFKPQK